MNAVPVLVSRAHFIFFLTYQGHVTTTTVDSLLTIIWSYSPKCLPDATEFFLLLTLSVKSLVNLSQGLGVY